MNDEHYEEIEKRLIDKLGEYAVGSEGYESIADRLIKFEDLRLRKEDGDRENWRINNGREEFEISQQIEREKNQVEIRDQKTRLKIAILSGAITLIVLEYTTNWQLGNPITNRIASGALGNALGKLLGRI